MQPRTMRVGHTSTLQYWQGEVADTGSWIAPIPQIYVALGGQATAMEAPKASNPSAAQATSNGPWLLDMVGFPSMGWLWQGLIPS